MIYILQSVLVLSFYKDAVFMPSIRHLQSDPAEIYIYDRNWYIQFPRNRRKIGASVDHQIVIAVRVSINERDIICIYNQWWSLDIKPI